MKYQDILKFWFEELNPSDWFKKDNELDAHIKKQYGNYHDAAIRGELFMWRKDPLGRLAEIIIIDQFSRNIFRNNPKSFLYDPLALMLSQEAINHKINRDFNAGQKQFLYLPYMHSESLIIHDEAIKLFSEEGLEHALDFEHRHKKIIEQFGRYPHRNNILGRQSTSEEIEFLKTPGSSF